MSFFENVDKFIKARLNFLVKKDVKRNSGLKPKVAKSESEIKERKDALFNKKLALLESLPFLQGAIPHLDLFKQAKDLTKEKLDDQLEFLLDVKSDF
jgi:hypothetical protein